MNNKAAKILGILFPVVQAPMYGVSTPEMQAAANWAGCLGSAALGDLDYERCIHIIRSCKKMTDRPFAVNLFVNEIPLAKD